MFNYLKSLFSFFKSKPSKSPQEIRLECIEGVLTSLTTQITSLDSKVNEYLNSTQLE